MLAKQASRYTKGEAAILDTKAYIKVETKDDVNVSYGGDALSLVILINLLISTVADDCGVSYEAFTKDLFKHGVKYDKVFRKAVAKANNNNIIKGDK